VRGFKEFRFYSGLATYLSDKIIFMNTNDFDSWNEKKKHTHLLGSYPYFSKRDIWWSQLGKNIATETLGKGEDFLRPVLILQVVYGNSCIAIPLTSKQRNGNYYYSFRLQGIFSMCTISSNQIFRRQAFKIQKIQNR
jgi:hypothetical protein